MSPENYTIQPQNNLDRQYLNLISKMRGDYEKGMITYLDSTISDFYTFCKQHPEYIPNGLELEEFTGRCDLFVQKIWGLNRTTANQTTEICLRKLF